MFLLLSSLTVSSWQSPFFQLHLESAKQLLQLVSLSQAHLGSAWLLHVASTVMRAVLPFA